MLLLPALQVPQGAAPFPYCTPRAVPSVEKKRKIQFRSKAVVRVHIARLVHHLVRGENQISVQIRTEYGLVHAYMSHASSSARR